MVKKIKMNLEKIKKCPVCKKPVKEYREFKATGIYIKIPILRCGCRKQDVAEAFDKKSLIDKLLKISKIDGEFLSKTFPVYRPEIKPYYNSLEWIRLGKQLLFYGKPGNHKTGHACEIMKKAIRERLYFCLYYRASKIPSSWMDEKKMLKCRLLIIDNFAKDKEENWRGANFDLIDYRIHNGLSNIIISNNPSMNGIELIYGAAMISRLRGFEQIEVDGRDIREKKEFMYGGPREYE